MGELCLQSSRRNLVKSAENPIFLAGLVSVLPQISDSINTTIGGRKLSLSEDGKQSSQETLPDKYERLTMI